jgi:hypothetical protein
MASAARCGGAREAVAEVKANRHSGLLMEACRLAASRRRSSPASWARPAAAWRLLAQALVQLIKALSPHAVGSRNWP